MPIKQINSAELIKIFKENKAVCVLDVRTDGEWQNIGRPDAEALGVETKFLSLMLDKDGQRVFNENFQKDFLALNIDKTKKIYCICRSGMRSQKAAEIIQGLGYETANISDGFENFDNSKSSWQKNGLPQK